MSKILATHPAHSTAQNLFRSSFGDEVDALLEDALSALESLFAFDAAAVLELDRNELRVLRVTTDASAAVGQTAVLEEFAECAEVVTRGFPIAFERESTDLVDPALQLPRGRFGLWVPLIGRRGTHGLLVLERTGEQGWSTGLIELLDVIGRLLGSAMESGRDSRRAAQALDRAEERTRLLEGAVDAASRVEVQESAPMLAVRESAKQLARGQRPVLIRGDAGVGKEVLARAMHAWSTRGEGPFLVFSCSAVPQDEQLARLFGDGENPGAFRLAEGGTLYLDDVERLSTVAQAGLEPAIRESADVRFMAATTIDLAAPSERGTFSEALYFALSGASLHVPPLSTRPKDVTSIAKHYLVELAAATGDGPWEFAERTLAWLERREWPGNVRELINVLDRATILSSERSVRLEGDPTLGVPPLHRGAEGISSLREVEKQHIERVLRATGGQIYGPRGAAALLEINPNTLRSRMKKLGLGGARSFRESVRTESEEAS